MKVKKNISTYLIKSARGSGPEERARKWAAWMENPSKFDNTEYNMADQEALFEEMDYSLTATVTDLVQFLDRTPVAVPGRRAKRNNTEQDLVAYMKEHGITRDKTNEEINEIIREQLDRKFLD